MGQDLTGLATQGQIEAEARVSRETLSRFARPKLYERLAEFASILAGLAALWPIMLLWTIFTIRPDLNHGSSGALLSVTLIIGCAFSVRSFTQYSSRCRRAVIRQGVLASFHKSGRPISGDFVGVAYSERILNLFRGVDWDYGFLELKQEGLRFEGERSSFLLTHDCVENTDLKQYRLPSEGWFVRLFVHWKGPEETTECFSVCFQECGAPKRIRHQLTETWKRRIEDWRWNHMGIPVTQEPVFPVDSSPVDNTLSRRKPLPPRLNRIAWICAVVSAFGLAAMVAVAMFFFSIDWGGGVILVILLYGPSIFRVLFAKLISRLVG